MERDAGALGSRSCQHRTFLSPSLLFSTMCPLFNAQHLWLSFCRSNSTNDSSRTKTTSLSTVNFFERPSYCGHFSERDAVDVLRYVDCSSTGDSNARLIHFVLSLAPS